MKNKDNRVFLYVLEQQTTNIFALVALLLYQIFVLRTSNFHGSTILALLLLEKHSGHRLNSIKQQITFDILKFMLYS